MKRYHCVNCNSFLEKKQVALNKKMIGRQITTFMCIECLAEYLDCTKEDLFVKIEEFTEQGCTLFTSGR